MAGPPSSAFGQVSVVYGGAALPSGAVTTHGFTAFSGVVAEIPDLLNDLGVAARAFITNDATVTEVRYKVGPSATGPTYVQGIGAAGRNAGPSGPPHTAALVRLNVGEVSSRFAGRFFLPCMPEGQVGANGVLSGALREAIQTAVQEFYGVALTAGMTGQVFSASSSDPRAVTSIQVQSLAATQRRRLRR